MSLLVRHARSQVARDRKAGQARPRPPTSPRAQPRKPGRPFRTSLDVRWPSRTRNAEYQPTQPPQARRRPRHRSRRARNRAASAHTPTPPQNRLTNRPERTSKPSANRPFTRVVRPQDPRSFDPGLGVLALAQRHPPSAQDRRLGVKPDHRVVLPARVLRALLVLRFGDPPAQEPHRPLVKLAHCVG